ncbi:MAG TPA: hypothetical protein VEO95_09345 [Chthoniobacteraceae bacterium]|nr:hypothetical protein [Chthoniobacteraceae bacterium]
MRLLLECKPDETLARELGHVRRDCEHLNDKGRVCNRLKRSNGLVAMIDDDPDAAQPPYLQELKKDSDEHGIRILVDPARGHRVIILQPRLEEWIIDTATAAKVGLEDFGLSNKGNELHREINFRLPAFVRLIQALAQAGSPRLTRLKEALRVP